MAGALAVKGGLYPAAEIAAAKGRLLAVVSQHVSLKRVGRNHVGLCPFHAEKTPSFTVNEERGIFHCFGCGVHGDALDFVRRLRGCGFREAAEELLGPAGSIPHRQRLSQAQRRRELERAARRRIEDWARERGITLSCQHVDLLDDLANASFALGVLYRNPALATREAEDFWWGRSADATINQRQLWQELEVLQGEDFGQKLALWRAAHA